MNTPLILTAYITILPGFEKEVKEATVTLATETRKEAGNQQFAIHTMNDSPEKLVFYEIYRDEQAFELHKSFDYAQTFFEFVKGKIENDDIRVDFLTALK